MDELREFYEGKTVLVTGGAGSIGSEIVRTLLKFNPKAIRMLDINETGLFELEQELKSKKIRLLIGDIRDKDRLRRAIEGVDIVFHAAALKHVPLCEYNPFEAVKTNVVGTQNLIDVALDEEVEKFITISTDKAVNPINVMGATKLLAERITTAANLYKGKRKTAFSVVRFGNVLNSRGSILPLIKNQIKKGGLVILTDPQMTRFIMSIHDAVMLVLKAGMLANLIEVIIEELAPKYGYSLEDIKIDIIGKRPGEKLFEELMTEEEAINANELEDMYTVYAEELYDKRNDGNYNQSPRYDSKNARHLTKEEIKSILKKIGYL
jgi:FlaA1/EpsC-like NDP-sugar epimerase